jgi:hypothetical protein
MEGDFHHESSRSSNGGGGGDGGEDKEGTENRGASADTAGSQFEAEAEAALPGGEMAASAPPFTADVAAALKTGAVDAAAASTAGAEVSTRADGSNTITTGK